MEYKNFKFELFKNYKENILKINRKYTYYNG